MKKWLALLVGLLLVGTLCGCVQIPQGDGASESLSGVSSGTVSSEEEIQDVYNIQYQCIVDHVFEDIFKNMKIPAGNYPTSYVQGEETIISPLQAYCDEDNTVYVFEGWYYDEDCTELVENNKLSLDKAGNIILYANINKTTKMVQLLVYKACLLGEIQEVPAGMFADSGCYPTVYTMGDEIVISDLKDCKINDNLSYEFKGWYLDSNCTIPLVDNTISDQMEVSVLYAKLAMWVKG